MKCDEIREDEMKHYKPDEPRLHPIRYYEMSGDKLRYHTIRFEGIRSDAVR